MFHIHPIICLWTWNILVCQFWGEFLHEKWTNEAVEDNKPPLGLARWSVTLFLIEHILFIPALAALTGSKRTDYEDESRSPRTSPLSISIARCRHTRRSFKSVILSFVLRGSHVHQSILIDPNISTGLPGVTSCNVPRLEAWSDASGSRWNIHSSSACHPAVGNGCEIKSFSKSISISVWRGPFYRPLLGAMVKPRRGFRFPLICGSLIDRSGSIVHDSVITARRAQRMHNLLGQ